jgi:hypothetical protein
MIRKVSFESLFGVWKRRFMRPADGSEDRETQVWWIQARPHFADLRIPAGRPSFERVTAWQNCNDVQRNWLARQQGFAGELTSVGDAWLWKRESDFQPASDKRDIGKLTFTDVDAKQMLEEGVDEPYTEMWEKIDDGSSTGQESLTLRYDRGMLVALGDHFIVAMDHGAGGVEISHGHRAGPIAGWIIGESTFPWREGEPLFLNSKVALDWNARVLSEIRPWKIVEPAAGRLGWL